MHFSHAHQDVAGKATKIALVTALHLLVASVLVQQMNARTFTTPRAFEDLTVNFRKAEEAPAPPPEPVRLEVQPLRLPNLVVPVTEVAIRTPDHPAISAVHPQEALPPPALGAAGGERAGPADARPATTQPPAMCGAVLADARSCATPDYPARAARNGETGTVTLALLVGSTGTVLGSRILSSSGSRDLDRAALAALSLCTFQPAMEGGVAQQGWAQIAYVWRLD